ncbi:hypothetical protein [Oscillatoria salina]|nr:hypothetical protein [Oscillatoria salina]MBZ8182665.1 hypothetical protein [Oscillatoria salina IIICB1]NET89871.1 hypothetical protein [Kamptonema sp. SIO1D9]
MKLLGSLIFNQKPYNENHKIVNHRDVQLALPHQEVQKYIENLKNKFD